MKEQDYLHIAIIYLVITNVVTFIGAWLGMKVWHHKTQHKKFKYGIPAIIIVQLAIIGYILYEY